MSDVTPQKPPDWTTGAFIRNDKCPYDGVCVVLEVRSDRLEVYTERGEHASIHSSSAIPADRASCITPAGPEKLGRAIDDHLRRRGAKKYFRAMRDGDAADQRGVWEEAARCFRQALEVEEDSGEARMKLATALRRSGAFESALGEYRRLMDKGEGSALVHFGAAGCLERLGMLEDAVTFAEKAIELNEELGDAYRLASAIHRSISERHAERGEALERRRKDLVSTGGLSHLAGEPDQLTLFD